MQKPKATRAEIEALVKNFIIPTKAYLVGVRGYYLRSMGDPKKNDRGIYDDAIFLITPEGFFAFNANTDPARYKTGIATLCPGMHMYKKGLHGLSKPNNAYPALRPATPDESLPVFRDGQNGVFKGIAINIHSGGLYSTSSAGCQTIYKEQWQEFITRTYKAMDLYGQKTIPYILIANDFSLFLECR